MSGARATRRARPRRARRLRAGRRRAGRRRGPRPRRARPSRPAASRPAAAAARTPAGPAAASGDPTRPHVVALGGGHGLATTLQAVRRYAGRVTAVVSVADDGGSSGRLRQIAGIPAPGDLRRCLVAMASDDSVWARAFEYRFPAGDLEGHALGNLLIAGLANVTGDFGQALTLAGDLLGSAGKVLPATSVPVILKADVAGTEVIGQVNVSETPGSISAVQIVPPDPPVPTEVLDAIADADQVVIGPGSLYTSVLAVCAVPGIRYALVGCTRADLVYVCNLRPQPPETAGFGVADHLRAVLDHGVPVDVMVAPFRPGPPGPPGRPGPPGPGSGALAEDQIDGIPVVRADLARAEGDGHDPALLAAVLRQLASCPARPRHDVLTDHLQGVQHRWPCE